MGGAAHGPQKPESAAGTALAGCLLTVPGVDINSKTEKFMVIKGKAWFKFRHMQTIQAHELVTSDDKPEIVETVTRLDARHHQQSQ